MCFSFSQMIGTPFQSFNFADRKRTKTSFSGIICNISARLPRLLHLRLVLLSARLFSASLNAPLSSFSSSLVMFISFPFLPRLPPSFSRCLPLSFCLPGHGLVKTSSALCLFSFISWKFLDSPFFLFLFISAPLHRSLYLFPLLPASFFCPLFIFTPLLPLFPYLFIHAPFLSLSLHLALPRSLSSIVWMIAVRRSHH